jgi:hypothetical protein
MNGPTALFQGVFTKDMQNSLGNSGVAGQGADTAVGGREMQGNSQTDASCHIFTSQQDANNFFGLGLNGGLQQGLLSVQDKFGYARNMNIATGDTVILVSSFQKITYTAVSVGPLPNLPFVDTSTGKITDFARFDQQFGDSYVGQIDVGGYFFGYFKLLTSRVSNGTQISNQISASLSNGVLSGNVSNTINSIVSNNSSIMAQVEECQIIGMSGIALPGPNDFVSFASQFPAMGLNAPVIIDFSAQPYSIAGLSV